MFTRVFNKRTDGALIPDGAVYVGRPSKWGNPFPVKLHGRHAAVALYREWLKTAAEAGPLRAAIRHGELHERDLVCWCAPEECHAHVLAEMSIKHYDPSQEDHA